MEQMEEADMWQMMETNISGGRLRDGGEGGGGGGEGHDLLPKDLLNKDQRSMGGVTVRRCMGNVNFYR